MGEILNFLLSAGAIIFAIAVVASSAIKVVQEYERGVIFRLGLVGPKRTGLCHHPDRRPNGEGQTCVVTLDIRRAITGPYLSRQYSRLAGSSILKMRCQG